MPTQFEEEMSALDCGDTTATAGLSTAAAHAAVSDLDERCRTSPSLRGCGPARSSRPLKRTLLSAAAVLSLALGACGGSDDESGTSGGSAAAATDSVVADAKALVDEARGPQEFQELEPTKPRKDGNVFLIPCSAALEGCATVIRAAEEAAKTLGWKTTVIDGKYDPQTLNAAVQRAVDSKATGIIIASAPQSMYSQGLASAKKAGIPVVSTTANNKVGPDGVDAELGSVDELRSAGELAASYVIAKSEGEASVLVLNDTSFTSLKPYNEGVLSALEKCTGCEVAQEVKFTGADVSTRLGGLVQTALQRNPDAGWIIAPYGGVAAVASDAVGQAGSDAQIVAYSGYPENTDAIRRGEQAATIDKALSYEGWRAVDTVARLNNGEQFGSYEEPHKLIDETNLPPEGTKWEGDQEYQADFKSLWGVE